MIYLRLYHILSSIPIALPSGLEWLQFQFDGSPITSQIIVSAALADLEAKIKNYDFEKLRKKLIKKKLGKKMLHLSPTSSGQGKHSPRDSDHGESPRSPKASTSPRDEGTFVNTNDIPMIQ